MNRSENMRAIRSKNTLPEMAVRSMVHKLGYRFRLHRKDLPGKPDLAFPSRRKVIFVNDASGIHIAARRGLFQKRTEISGCINSDRTGCETRRISML